MFYRHLFVCLLAKIMGGFSRNFGNRQKVDQSRVGQILEVIWDIFWTFIVFIDSPFSCVVRKVKVKPVTAQFGKI